MVVLGGGLFLMSEVPLQGSGVWVALAFLLQGCASSSSLLLYSLELSDTRVYEP